MVFILKFHTFEKMPRYPIPSVLLSRIGIICLLLISLSGFSQFNSFRNFSVKDGLPSSEVYEMIQDSEGYFWFPTDMGVSRFNGYEYKTFSTENGLPDNTIYGVYEDHHHNIWFRSISGKLAWYNKTGLHTLPCNDSLSKLISASIITSVYVDHKNVIWLGIAGFRASCLVKIGPGREKEDITKIDLPGDGLYIYEIEDGFVFGGIRPVNHLLSIYSNHSLLPRLRVKNKYYFINNPRLSTIRLSNKTYLSAVDNVILNFNRDTLLKEYTNRETVLNILEESDQRILLGTFDGVKVLTAKGVAQDSSFIFLDHKVVTRLRKDRENDLWIATKGHGVFYIPYKKLKYYTPANGLPESSISCLSVMGNKVVAGHLNGQVSLMDKNKVDVITLQYSDSMKANPNEVNSLLNTNTDLHLISSNHYTYRFDPLKNAATVFSPRGAKKLIQSRKNGTLWILGFRTLLKSEVLVPFSPQLKVRLPSYSDNIYEDAQGKLFICSSDGLWTYTETSGLSYEGNKDTLLSERVVDIAEDKQGGIWIATRGEGLLVKQGDRISRIKQKDGMTGNMCRTLFMDSADVVWVGTNTGLNKISIRTYQPLRYTIKNYTSKDGLLTSEVNHIVKFNGKLWLAHNSGISVFDPRHMLDDKIPSPVYITEVRVNEKPVDLSSTHGLPYNENHLTVFYNGLSYHDPGHVEYKYHLSGLDTNWIHTYYASVDFQALAPGSYTFTVYAKNNEGYWSAVPAVFSFSIHPAWWQTWWFRTLLIALTAAMLVFLFRSRLRIIRKREQLKAIEQNRLSEAELKALRAQMNPHFVFNAINSVQYFITNNDPVSSQKYLSKFAKLIRYVVDNSKPANIPLEKELEALSLYLDLESLRFENKFEYLIEVSRDIDQHSLQIPSMLIQPYVENAIWHGLMHKESPGRISIRIHMRENVLICLIEDNGIGRKRSQEIRQAKNSIHKSIGMSVTRERLDIINQQNNSNFTIRITDLEDEQGNSQGTRVELNLPFY